MNAKAAIVKTAQSVQPVSTNRNSEVNFFGFSVKIIRCYDIDLPNIDLQDISFPLKKDIGLPDIDLTDVSAA